MNQESPTNGPGVRGLLKSAMRRVLRPGVWEIEQTVHRIETAVERMQVGALKLHGAVWRGGADGSAITPQGDIDPVATGKYRDELAYWIAAVGGKDPAHGDRFVETFSGWQTTRLNELADRLGLDRGAAMNGWCASRDVVEIGGGPIPSCAFRAFRSAVAVDPLADGYLCAGVVPERVRSRAIVHLAACGERIPLTASCADLLIAENCLDHTDAPQLVAAEIHRLLRPSGLLWLLVDLMDYQDHMHPSPMNPARLDSILLPLGFSYLYRESWEGASHPMARLQMRVLLRRH